MHSAKDIIVKPISGQDANRVIRQYHYSGKCAVNPQLNFGVFLNGVCAGAMQFGPPTDKSKVLHLVSGTGWNEMLEINRLAFADWLPRNSESRAIGYAIRFIKKHYPHVRWLLSFADATQCGDGAIYRAAGFILTQIKMNKSIYKLPSGETIAAITTQTSSKGAQSYHGGGKRGLAEAGATMMTGFQLRYIYLIDKMAQLNTPVLPFSEIEKRGAKMYKGQRVQSIENDAPAIHADKGGEIPTCTLH